MSDDDGMPGSSASKGLYGGKSTAGKGVPAAKGITAGKNTQGGGGNLSAMLNQRKQQASARAHVV